MKNIFSDIKDYVKQPNRNVFDMSFQTNATFNFGTLYPVFCKEVIPGDSVSIDTTFALRFLPMAFPVQTKVQANLHFFYVRNRNLWENWKKFITHTDDVEFPVLDGSQSCLTTGGLADYLGVPTSIVGSYADTVSSYFMNFFQTPTLTSDGQYVSECYFQAKSGILDIPYLLSGQSLSQLTKLGTQDDEYAPVYYSNEVYDGSVSTRISISFSAPRPTSSNSECYLIFGVPYNREFIPKVIVSVDFSSNDNGSTWISNLPIGNGSAYYFASDHGSVVHSYQSVQDAVRAINNELGSDKFMLGFAFNKALQVDPDYNFFPNALIGSTADFSNFGFVDVVSGYNGNFTDLTDVSSSRNPFLTTNSISIPISALPFRAYESIYNSFYRNELNDPLFVNGKPTYDVYCPNTSDGVDDYDYKLYNRNWELDFLTSAVQSPQQGIAPLVGVSSAGNFTFVNKDSNGNVGYFTADAQFSSDGSTITGFKLSDKVQLSGIPTTDVGNVPEDIKRGTIYTLNQMALAGISINDFRNVNALQRWLETNIRRGYKYRDQIKSHFGVDVSYQELDMPEFIGGVSEPVFVNQVNQTTETDSDPLGSYAGQMSLLASSNHTIRHYADEHGFIMGIMSITPVPNYSQLLPKHFIKYNYLDYFFPEFGHIGMQPIDYREVCPLQAYGVNPSDVNNTFGYQRAWYDYIASVDEVHGLFRTNLRNFVLNRQFDTLPKLNKDFLQVDANQLNDIFTVQDISDKILGQIKFNCIFKRPIPKYGIPRLE